MALVVKSPPASARDLRDVGLILGLGRSPGGEHVNPPQYSCLENPVDRGTLQATVHGAARVGHDLVTKPSPREHEEFSRHVDGKCREMLSQK